jgi:hypothetical protein
MESPFCGAYVAVRPAVVDPADLEAGRTVSMEEAFATVEAELDLLLARPAGFAEE